MKNSEDIFVLEGKNFGTFEIGGNIVWAEDADTLLKIAGAAKHVIAETGMAAPDRILFEVKSRKKLTC